MIFLGIGSNLGNRIINIEKAKSILTLLSNEQIDGLKTRMNKGGRTKSN